MKGGKTLEDSLAALQRKQGRKTALPAAMEQKVMNQMGDLEGVMANMRAGMPKGALEGKASPTATPDDPENEGDHGSVQLWDQLKSEEGGNAEGEVDEMGEDVEVEEEDPEEKKARFAREVSELKAKADGGCLVSMNHLGDVLRKGQLGLPESPEIAARWYQRAAKEKHADAQYNLALCHYSGTGVQVDDPMCHALLLEAAKQDHAKAMTHLAQHFLTGQGGVDAPDYKEGVRWLRKASTAGDKTAQFNLGNVYYHGQYASEPSKHVNTRVTSASEPSKHVHTLHF
jgi:TPR repeat protein